MNYSSRTFLWTALALAVIYLFSRLWGLTALPIFVDEVTHINWAINIAEKGELEEAANGFRLFPVWLISLLVPLAADNLLLAARLVSVGLGLFGLGGCYALGQLLFGHRVGLIAALLYLVVPYTFFYDRMALVDSLLAILSIYIVFFSFKLVHQRSWRYSLALGLMLALVINTKINGFALAGLPLMVLIIQQPHSLRQLPWRRLGLAYGVGLLGTIPLLAGNSLEWWQLGRRVWLGRSDLAPWLTWGINAASAIQFLAQNLSVFVFIAAGSGAGLALLKRRRSELMLVVIAGLNIAAFVFIAKAERWYPRYLLPAVPFLLLLAAQAIILGLDKIKAALPQQKKHAWGAVISGGIMVIILLPALWFDYWLAVDPARAPFVLIDQWQYVSGIHAGYGLSDAAGFLRQQLAQHKQIIAVYDENPGVLSDAPQIYLYDRRAQIIHIVLDFSKEDPAMLAQNLLAQTQPVFVITSYRTDIEEKPPFDLETWPYVERVAHFERPGGLTGVNVYRGKSK